MKNQMIGLLALAVVSSTCLFGADQPVAKQDRTLTVSNVTYTVRYDLKSTNQFSVPLTNPLGKPHYECTATISVGTNRVGAIETQWTEEGCFEDMPLMLVGRALSWKRYPNNTAGQGLHWVVSGPAMWAEKDEP
jgi:hypothetical protein